MSDPSKDWQETRRRRRDAELARIRRQRRVVGAIIVLALAGAGAAVALAIENSGSDGKGRGQAVASRSNASPSPRHITTKASSSSTALQTTSTSGRTKTTTKRSSTTEATTSRQAVGSLAPLQGKTIAIDPGHNGGNYLHTSEINRLVNAGTLKKACDTTGTETNGGYTEAAYNLDVAQRLAAVLRAAGARVVLTRTTNDGWGPCVTERAAIGNRAHAAAAISIHADGGPATGRGFHVIYPPSIPGLTDDIASASKRLALDIRNSFRAGTGMPYATYIGQDGLDMRSDLGGLNLSNVPKVFIETGNMRNATDAALLTSGDFREKEAEALAHGLAEFLA
jgi:N-acetylmuramoyl-L-alanine amidase